MIHHIQTLKPDHHQSHPTGMKVLQFQKALLLKWLTAPLSSMTGMWRRSLKANLPKTVVLTNSNHQKLTNHHSLLCFLHSNLYLHTPKDLASMSFGPLIAIIPSHPHTATIPSHPLIAIIPCPPVITSILLYPHPNLTPIPSLSQPTTEDNHSPLCYELNLLRTCHRSAKSVISTWRQLDHCLFHFTISTH